MGEREGWVWVCECAKFNNLKFLSYGKVFVFLVGGYEQEILTGWVFRMRVLLGLYMDF